MLLFCLALAIGATIVAFIIAFAMFRNGGFDRLSFTLLGIMGILVLSYVFGVFIS
jgi:hypothetical protein